MQTIQKFSTWFSKQKFSGKLAIGCAGLVGFFCLCNILSIAFFRLSAPIATSVPSTITPVPVTPTIPIPSFDALLTDRRGLQTKVTDLKAHIHDSCGSVYYYIDASIETDFDWDFIRFFTGEYEIDVPFEIIQKVEVKYGDYSNEKRDSIILADGTVIQGRDGATGDELGTMLMGETDLGKFQIAFEDISEMTPLYEPSSSFIAIPSGTNNAILSLQDGTELKLENATFYRLEKNKNGCYLGNQTYTNSVIFETTGGSNYELTWEKMGSISFVREAWDQFNLVTPSGSEYSGRVPDVVGIEGTASLGNYILKVRVPFYSNAKSLTFSK